MAEAKSSGGIYNRWPKGPKDANHGKGSEEKAV